MKLRPHLYQLYLALLLVYIVKHTEPD